MNPAYLPFHALFVGPTRSGKTTAMFEILKGAFALKFSRIAFVCSTFYDNAAYQPVWEHNEHITVYTPREDELEATLAAVARRFSDKRYMDLVVLDDYAHGRAAGRRNGMLTDLAFRGVHNNISLWILAQSYTSIAKRVRSNMQYVVLFFNKSEKELKTVFEDLTVADQKAVRAHISQRYSYAVIPNLPGEEDFLLF